LDGTFSYRRKVTIGIISHSYSKEQTLEYFWLPWKEVVGLEIFLLFILMPQVIEVTEFFLGEDDHDRYASERRSGRNITAGIF
jgi:hypothetical protein